MGPSFRTLKAAVDVGRTAHDYLTDVDLDSQIETAGLKAGRHVADDRDDLEPDAIRNLIVFALEDSEQLADGVDELIERGEPVTAETELLAAELARLADELDPLAAVAVGEIDWTGVASTFLETFEREVAAMDSDQRWFLLQAYNQRVLDAVTPDEFAEARSALDTQGFNWLDEGDFAGEVTDPELAWRRPFDWKHIEEYTVERRRGDTGEPFVREVRETLADGGHQLIIGPPGSGKTTACKQIAAEWYDGDETGPVLYRESGGTGSPVNPTELAEAVETATDLGETLVVVEDAVRQDSLDIFRFAASVEDRDDVSLLVDAREHEWDAADDRITDSGHGTGVQRLTSEYRRLVDRTRVPYLSVDAVESLFETFVEKTDVDPTLLPDPQRVFERLVTVESRKEQREAEAEQTESGDADSDGAAATAESGGVTEIEPAAVRSTVGEDSVVSVASPMLLLSYYLPVARSGEADLLDDTESDDTVPSPLEHRVRQVFRQLCPDKELEPNGTVDATPLSEQVGLLSGVLSAAGVPLRKEFFYVLAESREEYRTIRRLLDEYRGWIHFGEKSENTLYAPHELWGLTYLYVHEDEAMDAAWPFAQCVNAVFSLFDDESARERVTAYGDIDDETGLATALEDGDTAATVADFVVSRVFQVGNDRPTLVSLFTGERDAQLTIPESCSGATKANAALYRARMFKSTGETEQWVRGLRESRRIAENHRSNTTGIQSVFYAGLATYARRVGEYDAAERLEQLSLERSRERGDESGEAKSLGSLGNIALDRGEFDAAEQYHERSLSIKQEIGDRSGEANSLGSLGNIARNRGEFDAAEQYHERSLSIFEEIGDRSSEAKSLGSLGNIARNRGEFETAKKRYQSALEIFAELGQVREVIQTIQTLVRTAEELDDEAAAREWAERGLAQLDDLDLAGLDEERHWFLTRHARLSGDPAELENLYTTALTRLLDDDLQTAVDRLEDVWDCRESFASDTDAYEICLRAGVGYAAPATQRDTDAAADVVESVSEEVAPHRDRLTEPAAALFDLLVDGETDHDPDSLGEPADRADPDLDDLERVAYAGLLERLVSGPNPLDLYESVIRDIVTDEAELETVVRSCFAAWDRHADTEGDQRRAALAAGVLLEAHRDLVEATLPGEREAVFETVREERDVLTEPIEALFEFLDTGATDHDPDALREAADTEEPTLADLERIVAAELLAALQSQ